MFIALNSFEKWIYETFFFSFKRLAMHGKRQKIYYSKHILVHPSIAEQIHNSITWTIFLVKLCSRLFFPSENFSPKKKKRAEGLPKEMSASPPLTRQT